MRFERMPAAHETVGALWAKAVGGDARWKAMPDAALELKNPFVQISAMAHWVAERANERGATSEEDLGALKKLWAADTPDSPSALFRAFQEAHENETCNPHDESEIRELLARALGKRTLN